MFKGNITSASVVAANTNIPFTTVWNTNNNTQYSSTDNAVVFLNGGKYNVNVLLNVTGVTGTSIGAELFANGTAIPESLVQTELTASTGLANLVITDTINVQPTFNNQFAELSVRLTAGGTVSNGIITVEKVR